MAIRKKSTDILKQQKDAFFNYIKYQEKYSEEISDLFFDDKIWEINDIDGIKDYLSKKGLSDEQIIQIIGDYEEFLKRQNYHGLNEEMTDDLRKSVKSNDKILNKIKKNILKEYSSNKGFIYLDVKKFIDEELGNFGKESQINLGVEISKLEENLNKSEKEKEEIERQILKLKKEFENLNIFQIGKKKKIKKEIAEREERNEKLEEEIEKIKGEYRKKIKLDNKIANELTFGNDIKKFLSGRNRSDIEECKKSIKEIKSELFEIINYLSEESINKIKGFVIEFIFENIKEKKNSLVKMINAYLNHFYFGEDKNRGFLEYYDYSNHRKSLNGRVNMSTKRIIPTIYSKSRIDAKIIDIIKDLGGKIETGEEINVDKNFLDDIFIHTTGFNVLDEILQEGGLISTNELRKRENDYRYNDNDTNNNDIKDSITQKHRPHKDIYFSKGYRKNSYGKHESDDDYVFIVNTMNNFANSGYGVPINAKMQPNLGHSEGVTRHDADGYSIISKSALEGGENSYSKIDVKDVYIFVSEKKKNEIEKNPKYKTEGANIIYIPEIYKGEMSYKLYEFMKSEIAKKEETKKKKRPIPIKIIGDNENIKSIDSSYRWAFCESSDKKMEANFNPIKGDSKSVIKFLEKLNKDDSCFLEAKRYSNFEIDFERLKNFLEDQKNNINSIKNPLKFPNELIILSIICTKLRLRETRGEYKRGCLNRISQNIEEFGYNEKEICMFHKLVERLCYIKEFNNLLSYDKARIYDFKDNGILKRCKDWNVDYNDMREFIGSLARITMDNRTIENVVEKIF